MDAGEDTSSAAAKLVAKADKQTQVNVLKKGRKTKGKKDGGVRKAITEFNKANAPKKPIDKLVLDNLRSAVMDVQSIVDQFGTFDKMINSKGWEHVSRETCINFVIDLHSHFAKWNKEIEDHERKV